MRGQDVIVKIANGGSPTEKSLLKEIENNLRLPPGRKYAVQATKYVKAYAGQAPLIRSSSMI
jgi:hypothetical protein